MSARSADVPRKSPALRWAAKRSVAARRERKKRSKLSEASCGVGDRCVADRWPTGRERDSVVSGGPRRKWLRWAWRLARGVVLSVALIVVLWIADSMTPGFRSHESYVMFVRGEPCIVGLRRCLWSVSVVKIMAGGMVPPVTPAKFDSTTGVASFDRFCKENEEVVAGIIELGRPWPIFRGVFVGLGKEQKTQNILTWSFAGRPRSLPTGVYWPGAIAWLVVFGVLGSAMWEAPMVALRILVRRRRARLGLCRKCGYSLEGISGACPECGRARDGKGNAA